MSFQEKFWLTILLALFAVAHVGGAFMLSSSAQEHAPAQLVDHGD
jgi:hypothetical protein